MNSKPSSTLLQNAIGILHFGLAERIWRGKKIATFLLDAFLVLFSFSESFRVLANSCSSSFSEGNNTLRSLFYVRLWFSFSFWFFCFMFRLILILILIRILLNFYSLVDLWEWLHFSAGLLRPMDVVVVVVVNNFATCFFLIDSLILKQVHFLGSNLFSSFAVFCDMAFIVWLFAEGLNVENCWIGSRRMIDDYLVYACIEVFVDCCWNLWMKHVLIYIKFSMKVIIWYHLFFQFYWRDSTDF